ncbi:Short-chain dehydrogenase TIC 32, chloroplastic [Glycine max]|nr:Short-chain dehydrogenase TIC 32, chloroplastic [Glycine max]
MCYGTTHGIGTETARVLVLRGVHVIMAARDVIAAKTIKEVILEEIPTAKVDAMELDLSSMASVRKFASEFISFGLPLNILINNAGISAFPFTLSKDNIELLFATNHLGHFFLTNLLLDTMKKTASESKKEGRIINVSSDGHQYTYPEGILFDKINDESSYQKWRAYGQSKLANILHANELARLLKEDGIDITANSLHPGAIITNIYKPELSGPVPTDLMNMLGDYLLKSIPQRTARTEQNNSMWWPFWRKGGSAFSSSSTADEVTEGIDGTGLTAIVTGATSGIGAETTRVLAMRGVHVIMGVRNMNAAKDVKGAILKEIPAAKVDAMELDLSSMASVRKFASEFISSGLPLNILINNAGVFGTPFTLSTDAIELQFATNHMDTMKKTTQESKKQGRIVNISSILHQLTFRGGIPFDKINDPSSYHNWLAYGQSKLANILHANELARRLKQDGVDITANSLHPGAIVTNIFRHTSVLAGIINTLGRFVFKNVQQRERESNSEEKRLFAFSTLFCRRFHSETDQNGMWWPCGRNGGSSFSSSSTAEQVTEGIDGTGLTAIVTGASSGIGAETTRVLAMRGVHVIMGVRNVVAAKVVMEAILKEIPNAKVDAMELDLSSMISVRKFALEFISSGLPLNILINNAGIFGTPFKLSEDNIELQFATNHMGHFLLTNLLLDTIKRTTHESKKEGRIVNISSSGHQWLNYRGGILFDKINDESSYQKFCAYGQSKLANILHANELARRIPGVVKRLLNLVIKNVQQGAATTCYVALHPEVRGISGEYFADNKIAKANSLGRDIDLAKKLWDFSMNLIKVEYLKKKRKEQTNDGVAIQQNRSFWVFIIFYCQGSYSWNRWKWSHCYCYSGLGAETARVLALRDVHVIMGVIDMIGAKTVKEAILKEVPTAKVDVMELDLSSMTSIRNFASKFNSYGLSLNILINNAGICAAPFALSKDNIELQFAINYIGHFLLTNALLDTMKKTTSESKKQGRIVNVSSIGYRFTYHEGILFDKINDQSSYNNWCAYGQSKLANILHANELARRLKEDGIDITANSVHPGGTRSTNIHIHNRLLTGLVKIVRLFGVEKILGLMAKNVQQGASTTCYVALHPQVSGINGKHFADNNLAEVYSHGRDVDLAKKLWDFSINLTK